MRSRKYATSCLLNNVEVYVLSDGQKRISSMLTGLSDDQKTFFDSLTGLSGHWNNFGHGLTGLSAYRKNDAHWLTGLSDHGKISGGDMTGLFPCQQSWRCNGMDKRWNALRMARDFPYMGGTRKRGKGKSTICEVRFGILD